MTGLADTELQRARWRRVLQREALDTIGRDDFAIDGLARRLRAPSVRLLLMPADPEAELIDIDDGLWAWMKNFQTVEVGGRSVHLGTQHFPTAHAAALVDSHGSREPWSSYIAIHRCGSIEYGLGDRGAWERKDNNDNLVRVFNLISIVSRTWALLKFATALRERVAPPGPYQLTVGLHRTGGALLGNVGEGWAEPLTWDNELPGCTEPHLLWHLELAQWPDDDDLQRLAFRVGDHIEEAWGTASRRYLAQRGDLLGRLDVRQLHQ